MYNKNAFPRFEHVIVHMQYGYSHALYDEPPNFKEYDFHLADWERLNMFISRISPEIRTSALTAIHKHLHNDPNNALQESFWGDHPGVTHYHCDEQYDDGVHTPTHITTKSALVDDLHARGVTHVVMNGYFLDACVLDYACFFKNAGFQPVIISDLTFCNGTIDQQFDGSNDCFPTGNGLLDNLLSHVVAHGINVMSSSRFLDTFGPYLAALPQPSIPELF